MNEVRYCYPSAAALGKSLQRWQKRLRIEDWDIEVTVVRSGEMTDVGVMGLCGFSLTGHAATIKLLNVIDYDSRYIIPYDAEAILVHELLHVVFARITPDQGRGKHMDEMEAVINQLAASLVEGYRAD